MSRFHFFFHRTPSHLKRWQQLFIVTEHQGTCEARCLEYPAADVLMWLLLLLFYFLKFKQLHQVIRVMFRDFVCTCVRAYVIERVSVLFVNVCPCVHFTKQLCIVYSCALMVRVLFCSDKTIRLNKFQHKKEYAICWNENVLIKLVFYDFCLLTMYANWKSQMHNLNIAWVHFKLPCCAYFIDFRV